MSSYGDCSACVDDFDHLATTYRALGYVAIAISAIMSGAARVAAGKRQAGPRSNTLAGAGSINGAAKQSPTSSGPSPEAKLCVYFTVISGTIALLVIGGLLHTVYEPDCKNVDSCMAVATCAEACSEADDEHPVWNHYGDLALVMGSTWVLMMGCACASACRESSAAPELDSLSETSPLTAAAASPSGSVATLPPLYSRQAERSQLQQEQQPQQKNDSHYDASAELDAFLNS